MSDELATVKAVGTEIVEMTPEEATQFRTEQSEIAAKIEAEKQAKIAEIVDTQTQLKALGMSDDLVARLSGYAYPYEEPLEP